MTKIATLQSSILFGALFSTSSALFGEWNSWSTCSETCNGEQQRTRPCQTITRQPCEDRRETRICNTSGCHPSLDVVVTSAVLGVLILVLLVVLIILIIKTRIARRNENHHETVFNFENPLDVNIPKNYKRDVKKEDVQHTPLSENASTVLQVTNIPAKEGAAESVVNPWGHKDVVRY